MAAARRIPPCGQMAVAVVSIVAESGRHAMPAGKVLYEATKFAAPRVKGAERAKFLESLTPFMLWPGRDESWLPGRGRQEKFATTARKFLDFLTRVSAGKIEQEISITELMTIDLAASPQSLLPILIELEKDAVLGGAVALESARSLLKTLGEASAEESPAETEIPTAPWLVRSNLRVGIGALSLAVARREWAVLACDHCSRSYAQYGEYHRDTKLHFCSPRCRMAYHRARTKAATVDA